MIIQQPSKLLSDYGIIHGIGGAVLNFKIDQGERKYQQSLDQLLNALSIQPFQLHHAKQVHGANVRVVDHKQSADLFANYPFHEGIDGFVTNISDVTLLVRHADCTPIILYDPVQHAIGAVHSGWRGTVQKISIRALEKMQQFFGTNVEDVIAYVGPSIDQEHYEVGSEVYEAFANIGERTRYFKPQGDKYLLDMIAVNCYLLEQAGVIPYNIESTSESTYTSSRLHSARDEGVQYQLNACVVQLSKKV